MQAETISVVIPSWKGKALLERTLPSVLSQEGVEYRVLVVENGIADDTEALVRELQKNHANLDLLRLKENKGYAGGVNAGVAAARSKIVAVLCNDNFVEPNWLKELYAAYGSGISPSGKPIGAIMSQTMMLGLSEGRRGTLNFLGRNITFPDEAIHSGPVPIFYPGGNAFLLDKSVLPEVFDPEYFTYHEDVFLGWRLRNRGYDVLYCHRSIARSFDGGTTRRTLFRTAFLSERNRWLNFLSFCEWRTLAKLLPFLVMDQFASIVFGRNRLAKTKALSWLFFRLPVWLRKRAALQSERRSGDRETLQTMSARLFSEPCSPLRKNANRVLTRVFSLMGLNFRL